MIKSATAVKAKIRNKAGGNSDKAQIMLRIYLMERLLERVSLSKYRDSFVLKGGLLVSSLVGVDMRSTMDVDTTVKSLPLNKESARKILEEIMAIDLEDGVVFRITKVQDIMVRAEANTRMRDFYDIHVLLEQDEVTVDRNTMRDAFYATCKRRESTEQIAALDDVINKIADDEVMKRQWDNYRRTNYYVGKLEWDEVIVSARTLGEMVG